MKVDIIVRAKNGHELTGRCIESIRANTPREQYRLILVDDGSEVPYGPNDADVIIRHAPSKGAVTATNLGLGVALLDMASPYVAVFDNDTEVPAGDITWLSRFVAALEAGGPRCACVGATTSFANPPQHILTVPETYTTKWSSEQGNGDSDNPEVIWFVSFACLMRKKAVLEVGFWDVQFDPGNYEDTDYAVRLRDAGWQIRVAQSVYIHHHGHATFSDRLNELLEVNGKKFRVKHGIGHLWDLGMVVAEEMRAALRGSP